MSKFGELSDAELREVAALAIEELRRRETRGREEIIARIKALAAEAGISVTIKLRPVLTKPKKRRRAVKKSKAEE